MGLLRLAQESPRVARETPVMEAVRAMIEAKIGAIAVTTGRRIVGIFTERDLMKRVVYAGRDPHATLVGDVMTSPVETVSDSTSVSEASEIMRARHIRHLPVVDAKGEMVGMVGLRYLLYDLMNDLELKVDTLEGFIMADGIGG